MVAAIAHIATMNSVLKIVDPTTVPRPTSPALSVKKIDTTAMKRVGAEEPMAMKVAPATSLAIRSREHIW